jgi:hypothetical protein
VMAAYSAALLCLASFLLLRGGELRRL